MSGFAAYRGRLVAVWLQRDYRWFWIGSSLQGLGQGTQFMVIGWLVLLVTDSSAQLGLVILLYGAPNVALLLVAGVLADGIDRRYILMATQAIVGGVIAALAFLTIADLVAIWHVYAAAFFMGVVQSLSMPARMTMIGDLVEERSVLDAVAMQSMGVHAGRMVGPPVAGAIIEVWSVGASLAAIAGCYLVSMACIAKVGPLPRWSKPAGQSVFKNFADGLVYIKRSPMVLTVIIIT